MSLFCKFHIVEIFRVIENAIRIFVVVSCLSSQGITVLQDGFLQLEWVFHRLVHGEREVLVRRLNNSKYVQYFILKGGLYAYRVIREVDGYEIVSGVFTQNLCYLEKLGLRPAHSR